MKIAVVGAGAMGSLYGGRLAQAGEEVWLYDLWQDHVSAICENGLTIISPADVTTIKLRATSSAEAIGPADLVIIFVKSHATREAAVTAASLLGPETMVLTLQNGLGNAETIAEVVGADRVVVGTTAMGATVAGPGRIIDGGKGPTHIGKLNNGESSRKLYEIAAVFSRSGLYTAVDANVTSLRWGKLAVNAGINAVTAVTGIANGQLIEHQESLDLVKMAIAEVVAVAAAAGIPLPHSNLFEQAVALARATKDHRSSMLQDVLKKRRTEIDAINGAVVREGRRLGVPTPVNEVLTTIVKTIEKTYL